MDDLSGFDWSSKTGASQPKPSPMNPPSFSMRPTPSPFAGSSGRSTPVSAQGTASSGTATPATKPAAQDSFSNLMKFGPAKSGQNQTLAERQAQLELEKRRKLEEERKATEQAFGNGQFWDSLGSGRASASPSIPAPPQSSSNDDDDLFAAFNKDTKVDKSSHYPPPTSQKSTPAASNLDLTRADAWGGTKSSNGVRPEDDDPFGLGEMKQTRSPAAAAPAQAMDDDFLGDLAKPVEEVRRKQKTPQPEPGKPIELDESSSSEDEPPAESARTRSSTSNHQPKQKRDPAFDRAVAQLTDYGFSPEDAERGLTNSGAGNNVQAAANWLLDDAHRKSKAKSEGRSVPEEPRQPPRRNNNSPSGSQDPDFTKTAAAVGNSLFKTANSLWKTGQKRMQQAVADFQQEGDPNQPKWMRDAQAMQTSSRQSNGEVSKATDEALMLDSGRRPAAAAAAATSRRPPAQEERRADALQTAKVAGSAQSSSRSSPVPRWQQQSAPPLVASARSRLDKLASNDDDSFGAHVSRRRKPASPAPAAQPAPSQPEADLMFDGQAAQSLPQRPAQQQQQQQPPKRPATQPPKVGAPKLRTSPQPMRQIPPIDASSLQSSTKHRLAGTAHFKRGDYAAAHESYSSSLRTIPSQHPLTILLLTNRALTALKTGEPKQAIDDADTAIQLVGSGKGVGEVVEVKNEQGQDERRDMRDLYGKALSRKAEALEQMEKWADAGAVWQSCVEAGLGGANAIKGRQRCQNALKPKTQAAAKKPTARPKPKPGAAASLAPARESEAVVRMRAANAAAAKEDDERFALADSVDAKISAWRDGKRDNLRALLGSLDTVLWADSGWKKVGMHELVMANKVKIAYMKAIAKTHPDKIAQDASTEVRLIAGLVFSTLNESWDKFKTENGL